MARVAAFVWLLIRHHGYVRINPWFLDVYLPYAVLHV